MDDYGNGIPEREEKEQEPAAKREWLGYVPAAAFALYSLLLFLLFLAPAAAFYGISANIYQEAGSAPFAALIAFAVIGLVAALAGLAILPYPFFDLGKKVDLTLVRKIFAYLPFLFYFLIYSITCSLSGALSAVGAGPACGLIIAFTLLFALAHAVCLLLPKFKK